MEKDWMKVYRRPLVHDQAKDQVSRLSGHDKDEMILRIRAGDGFVVPGRDQFYLTRFGHPRNLRVLWRVRDDRTPVIMSVVDMGDGVWVSEVMS